VNELWHKCTHTTASSLNGWHAVTQTIIDEQPKHQQFCGEVVVFDTLHLACCREGSVIELTRRSTPSVHDTSFECAPLVWGPHVPGRVQYMYFSIHVPSCLNHRSMHVATAVQRSRRVALEFDPCLLNGLLIGESVTLQVEEKEKYATSGEALTAPARRSNNALFKCADGISCHFPDGPEDVIVLRCKPQKVTPRLAGVLATSASVYIDGELLEALCLQPGDRFKLKPGNPAGTVGCWDLDDYMCRDFTYHSFTRFVRLIPFLVARAAGESASGKAVKRRRDGEPWQLSIDVDARGGVFVLCAPHTAVTYPVYGKRHCGNEVFVAVRDEDTAPTTTAVVAPAVPAPVTAPEAFRKKLVAVRRASPPLPVNNVDAVIDLTNE
jgi:hypothetical protein